MTRLAPTIHADLSPVRRAAFGRWVAAVYGWVSHIDACPFGCTAERTACCDGDAAVADEQAAWQAWSDAVDARP